GAAVAEVNVRTVRSGSQAEGGDVRRRDAVEVVGLSQSGGQTAGHDPHGVVSGRQVREGVIAVAAGARGGDDGAAGVQQLDRHPVEARFTSVLDAVAVAVEPDAVAYRGGAAVAEVNVRAVGTAGQAEGGDVGGRDAVEVVARSHTRRQGGHHHADRVGAGRQVRE